MSRISVVIPTYNAAAFLPEALASVGAQTRAPDEVVVVDDCSRDASPEIARSWGARTLVQPANAGPAAARNAGIRAARGDLIAFLDADDAWEPRHLELVAGLLDRHADAAVAFGRERRVGTWAGEHERVLPDGEPADALMPCLRANLIPQMGVVVRREALLAAGGYDETMRYSEDYDLWLRLALRHRFVATHAVTCIHRGHPEQASARDDLLTEGAYRARFRVLDQLRRTGADRLPAAEAAVLAAWTAHLRRTWRARNWKSFDAALALADRVPGAAGEAAAWRRRSRFLRPARQSAGWMWDRLPEPVRASLRALRPA